MILKDFFQTLFNNRNTLTKVKYAHKDHKFEKEFLNDR